MAGPLLGRRMLLVAAVEESPRPSLHAGLFRIVPHCSALCADRFWAWTRFRFEGRFSSVSGLAHYTILHRAWRSREHCSDGSLPSSRQGVADQESVDVNDAYCFLHLQPIGHPRICCLWRLEPALPFRFVSGVLACVGVGRRWLYQSRSENLVGTQPWTNNYHNGSTYCSTGQRTDNQDRHPV